MDGTKEILGYQIAPTESSAAWGELLTNFKERGLERVLHNSRNIPKYKCQDKIPQLCALKIPQFCALLVCL
jgi:transposase-like protein